MTPRRNAPGGFTLVEIIAALVLAALLAGIAATIFDRQIVAAYKPAQNLRNALQVTSAMEAISRDYDALATKSASDLTSLAGKVNSFNANYGTYCATCTASAATTTVGSLNNALLVTVTHPDGGTAYHVFTVQAY
jgi:prepilin-type N-terminal cleavage/methylation domain-containing protein